MCFKSRLLKLNIIEEIQKEAYNEAIRDAVENAFTRNIQIVRDEDNTNAWIDTVIGVDSDSILKLLKE